MKEEKNGFIRRINFYPAWDRTDPDPSKNYGISDVEIRFVLIRGGRAVELQAQSGWHLPHVFQRRMDVMKKDIFIGKEQYLWERFAKEFLVEICLYDTEHTEVEYDDWLEFKIENNETYLQYEFNSPVVYYFWLPNLEKAVWSKFITEGEETLWIELEKIYTKYFIDNNWSEE
jgi:hypothetical protein